MIQIGNDKIKDIYVGRDKIRKVYYGSEKVWPIQDGYWVHKNTGVKTYFGLDDPSIVNGIMSPPSWGPNCSEVNIPEGVTSLGIGCFEQCMSLASITLPESVVSLGDSCFAWCGSLTLITLPRSVTSIGGGCFASCHWLTSITLPESVTSLGNGCFQGCGSLTLVIALPAIPPSLGWNIFDNVHTAFNIKVRSPYVNAYKTDMMWFFYADKISAI